MKHIIATIRYYLGQKAKYLQDLNVDLQEFQSLLPKKIWKYGSNNKYDHNNLQYYIKNNVNFNDQFEMVLFITPIPQNKRVLLFEKYVQDMAAWGIETSGDGWYDYYSGAVHTEGWFDVHAPGHLIVKSTVSPDMGIWIYDEWHESHGNTKRDGDYVFEIDLAESGANAIEPRKILFQSAHVGTSYPADNFSVTKIYKNFAKRNKLHIHELIWNGRGIFEWRINGITTKMMNIHPHTNVRPTLKITQAVSMPIGKPRELVVPSVLFKGKYVPKKEW